MPSDKFTWEDGDIVIIKKKKPAGEPETPELPDEKESDLDTEGKDDDED